MARDDRLNWTAAPEYIGVAQEVFGQKVEHCMPGSHDRWSPPFPNKRIKAPFRIAALFWCLLRHRIRGVLFGRGFFDLISLHFYSTIEMFEK